MRYRLDLVLRPAEGALLRVLGTAERRGFTPLAIAGEQPLDGGDWRLQVTVHGQRAPESLQRQIEQLHDCLSVEIAPCP
jgi:acetolactate synthase II small subunit